MKTAHTLSRLLPTAYCLLLTAYCLLISLLLQVTIINNVNAQIIHGPEYCTFGTYYIDSISPYIKYTWVPTNGTITYQSGINPLLVPNWENAKVKVEWDWSNPQADHKLEVTEEPLFGPVIEYLDPNPANINNPNPILDDSRIKAKIDAIKNGPGIGTVHLGAGLYYVLSVLIPEGIRLEGDGAQTILRRPISYANDPGYNNVKMLTTYIENNAARTYSFLAVSDMNSKPIEIRYMTLDGNKTIPSPYDNTSDNFQEAALILLTVPHHVNAGAGVSVNGTFYQPPNYFPPDGYNSTGPGKLKAFINNCIFENCAGDAVLQEENVDLNMIACSGYNIYRGTFTLVKGASKAKLKSVKTFTLPVNNSDPLTKAIDLEVLGGQVGYGNTHAFRLWMDNCEFDKNVQLNFASSNVLLTDSKVLNPPIKLEGYQGNIATNNCEFAFTPFNSDTDGELNYIAYPSHAKFKNTTFNLKYRQGQASCFNGIYFKHYAGQPYLGAHVGFDHCTFNNQSLFPAMESHGIYLTDPQANNQNIAQFFFNACTNVNNEFQDLITLYSLSGGCPVVSNPAIFNTGVINQNAVYTGGESEDEMKTHYGIRKFNLDEHLCNPVLASNPAIDLWYNPSASQLIAHYGNATLSNKQLYISGIFEVDADLLIDNCDIWFNPSGEVQFQSTHDLMIQNGSVLQASCEWWQGISAGNLANIVGIKSGSTIKNAVKGVYMVANAILEVENAQFADNGDQDIYMGSMTLNPYPGYIKGSTFTTQQNLSVYGRTKRAIYLSNVKQLNIGEPNVISPVNTFDGMFTGIYITNSATSGTSNIGIYNNQFSNILASGLTDNDKLVATYTDPKGAAIFNKSDGFQNMVSYVDVQNDPSNLTQSFANCDKAIVALGCGLSAKNLRASDCLLGIMCNSIYSRHFVIENNDILNVHMGIQLSGNQRSASILNNVIEVSKVILTNYGNIAGPIGIKYQVGSLPGIVNYSHTIADNNITINRISGIGIYNGNADDRLEEKANNTYFTTTNTVPAYGHSIPGLIGYWNENNNNSKYIRNTTNGITNANVWPLRNSMGMYMNQSKQCVLSCNRLKFTRYGFYVWGNNETAEEKVTLNKCNANEFPWFFADLNSPGDGTFGNVGGTNDNGNEFLSTNNPVDWMGLAGINTSAYKVYRNGSGSFFGIISTDPNFLDQNASGPLFSNYEYLVQPPGIAGYTDLCPDNNNDLPEFIGNPQIDSNEYISALAVANDSVSYNNFPIVGGWIEKYRLYLTLDTDSMLLNSSPELLYFYNTTSSQTIGDIKYAADKIALLYDSTTNASNDSLRYADAVAANTLISSANDWEINEKKVNDVLLFLYKNPVDSVSLQMKEDVQSLASSCPFVEGSAVYRMRPIWNLWQPNAIFDDRLLCIQGQNKNQDNSNINIDSLIESQIVNANNAQQSSIVKQNTISAHKLDKVDLENSIKIYPNPATNYIIIEYQSKVDGTIRLFNSLGETVLNSTLSKESTKTQLMLNDLANGIYHYEVEFANMKKTIGKLTILK